LGTPQTFTGTANASCFAPIVSYQWDFETDGTFDATGPLVGNTYAAAGPYTATLEITDSDAPPTVTACTVDVDVLAPGMPAVAYDTGFNPPATLVQVCGDGDSYVEPEEQWSVTVSLVNNSPCATATNVQADLTVNAGSAVTASIQIEDPPAGEYGNIVPLGTATATYCIWPDTAAVCIDDIKLDVTNITSNEGVYPNELDVFDVTVGGQGAGETGTQAPDPIQSQYTVTATADFTPDFTLGTPQDVATVDFDLTYVPFVPSEAAATADDYKAKDGTDGDFTPECTNSSGLTPEPLVPAFALPGPAEHFIFEYVLTHGTDPQACAKVSIIDPLGGECLLKDFQDPIVSPIDRPACYVGPGTYSLRLCEDADQGPKCGSTAQISNGDITATMQKANLGGNIVNNAKVEWSDSLGGWITLKDYNEALDLPYYVTAEYNAAGPGTYQIRVTEDRNDGGTAVLAGGTMFVGDIQCDLGLCESCSTGCVWLTCQPEVVGGDLDVCLGTPQTYNVNTTGGELPIVSYEWDFDYVCDEINCNDGIDNDGDSVVDDFDVDATGQSPAPYAQPAAGTYTVAARVTDSCIDPVAQVTICTLPGIVIDDKPALAYDSGFTPVFTGGDTAGANGCGDGDAIIEPDEDWFVTVQLINNATGCVAATNAVATLTSNPGSAVQATVHNNPGDYGTIALGATAQATYCFSVDAGAVCVNDITFDVTSVSSDEGPGTDATAAFTATVGVAGTSETSTQATDPLVAKGSTVLSDLAPDFTIAQAAATNATLTWGSLTCQGSGNAPIFTDDGGTDPAANGWTVGGAKAMASTSGGSPDTCPGGGLGNLLLQNTTYIERVVDTTGYNNILVHTDWMWTGFDQAPDCVTFSYSTNGGADWVIWFGPAGIDLTCGGATFPQSDGIWECDHNTGILPPAANNNPNFMIRFESGADGNAEHLRLDNILVEGFVPGCFMTNDTKVELIGPTATTTLKDFTVDPALPYDVLPYYEGPGTYQIQLTESSAGGAATLAGTSMSVNTDECDVGGCAGAGCGACSVSITPTPDPAVICKGEFVDLAAVTAGTVGGLAGFRSSGALRPRASPATVRRRRRSTRIRRRTRPIPSR
jgi:hypothetical protein